jgi:hypothetical protein
MDDIGTVGAAVPGKPRQNCWGCGNHCPSHQRRCEGVTPRTPHPSEVWGEDWAELAEWAEVPGAGDSEGIMAPWHQAPDR